MFTERITSNNKVVKVLSTPTLKLVPKISMFFRLQSVKCSKFSHLHICLHEIESTYVFIGKLENYNIFFKR